MKELIFHAFGLEMRLFSLKSLLILMQDNSYKILACGGIHKAKGQIYRKKTLNPHIATGNTFLSPLYRNLKGLVQ